MEENLTYIVIDGENIDATLGMSVLGRRPEPDERPRWDRVLDFIKTNWEGETRGLFFLNASSGHIPMAFVQALIAMEYRPIPLSGNANEKVVDVGVQKMLQAILDSGRGNVIVATHDADFRSLIADLLDDNRQVGVMCFKEFLSSQLHELANDGLTIIDMEHDVRAFTVPLPRMQIIPLDEFDPTLFL